MWSNAAGRKRWGTGSRSCWRPHPASAVCPLKDRTGQVAGPRPASLLLCIKADSTRAGTRAGPRWQRSLATVEAAWCEAADSQCFSGTGPAHGPVMGGEAALGG